MNTTKFGLMTVGLGISIAAATPQAWAVQKSKGSAVVWPVVFSNHTGTKTARDTAVQAVDQALQKGGYTLVSSSVAGSNWRHLNYHQPTAGAPASPSELIKFGKAVHARYVVAPVIRFHTRSIWVNVGPRTISTAFVTITITDTQTGKVVYKRVNVRGRSDAKNSILKDAGDVLVTPLVTVVSGGPKTPEEQRAAQIAVAEAMRGWVMRGK